MRRTILTVLNLSVTPLVVLGAVSAFLFFSFLGGVWYCIEWLEEGEED